MKTSPALAIVPLLVFTVSGCTLLGAGGGGTGGSEEPAEEESSRGEVIDAGSTDCLIDREWNLDVQDAAAQLGETLASQGQDVVSSTGVGSQSIWFDQEGYAGSATDLTYTLVVNMDAGVVMTMNQRHAGAPGGMWAWEGEEESTLTFTDWNGDYTVTTEMSINGSAAPSTSADMGGLGGLGGTSMVISCDGDSLTTETAGSPFAQHWTAGADR